MANDNLQWYPIPPENGYMEMQQLANPAVGSNFDFTIPDVFNEWRYRIHSLHFHLHTDANVANRFVGIYLYRQGGAYVLWRSFVQTVVAGDDLDFVFDSQARELTTNGINAWWWYRLPHCELTSWFRLGSCISGLQVGDQISDIEVTYRRWLDQHD